ncbi:MAG: glycosyltransferase [Verrucomicrobia bacterium]|nr:glycosyltransferase [Verrucomicrobiota bacterium]
MTRPSICYSIADQDFERTKSVGIFNLSMGLLRSLIHEPGIEKIHVLTNPTQKKLFPADGIPNLSCSTHPGPTRGKLRRLLWDQSGVYSAARKSHCDWLFLPKGFMSFVRRSPIKTAAYVHDAMHDHYKRLYPSAVSSREATYFERCFNATLRHADVIFTNSEYTAGEVQRMATSLGIPQPRVLTCGIGFNPVESHVVFKENRIVVLAGRFPHKKTRMALEFLDRWQSESGNQWGVDWIGSFPDGVAVPSRPNWFRHSRLPDEDFHDMIRRARVLVFTSDYEGFGMPPVEATLLGTMPVYSAIPATLEVMDDVGFAFENDNFDSFSMAMQSALHTDQDVLIQWGEELLLRHSWKRVAQRVMHALSSA